MDEADNQINDLEHKEANQKNKKKKEFTKIKDSIRSLWDISRCTNSRIIQRPEGEEEEQEIENLLEKIMKENLPNLAKEIDLQVQEAQRVPNQLNPKRTTTRHIIIKMPKVKDKERILKATTEKQIVTYKGVPKGLSADFSKETLQARRDWQEVFKVMESKDLQPILFNQAKLSFRMEGQTKCFPDMVKLKEFIITKPLL